jgi:hypothetical protein
MIATKNLIEILDLLPDADARCLMPLFKTFIQIYHIGRRRDVYEQLKRLLAELQKS